MVEAKVSRTYNQYRTITKEQAWARGFDGKWINSDHVDGSSLYDYRTAREYLTIWPSAIAVDFATPHHNDYRTRYTPPDGYICYIKSTGGRWGKSHRVRFGGGIRKDAA